MEMNGPADEVGPLERLYRSGDEGLNYLSEVTALGPVEDAPIADQRHIPAPPVLDAAGDLPPSTCSGAHVFVVSQHGCVRCGYDPDEPDEQEILALRELLPRGKRRHVDEMFAADERRAEAERAEAERMTRFRKIAAAASPGVLALLREIWEDGFEWGQADWGKNPFEES